MNFSIEKFILSFEQRHFPHFAASDIKGHWADHRRIHPQSLIIFKSAEPHPFNLDCFFLFLWSSSTAFHIFFLGKIYFSFHQRLF
jgi:hypothetical protein